MSELVYQLRDVIKEYNGRRVLHVEHLDIRQGEIFAIVGPSGAGKSTLLRLLNFLESPTSGQICFLGVEFSAEQLVSLKERRRVTTVFQRPILLNRTVWGNVKYGLQIRGEEDATCLVEKALEQVGLQDLRHQQARTLSGGEAQRVALARAIVLQSEVLLLDEPTANLDPYNVGVIEDIIRRVNREYGTTQILVTHNVFQAKRLAHRAALLLEGRIVEIAEAKSFFEFPRDPRTLSFVRGEMVY